MKEQIIRALDKRQLPPNLDKFRQNLSNCTYEHLKQIWELERKTIEEKEAQARPIVYVQNIVNLEPAGQITTDDKSI